MSMIQVSAAILQSHKLEKKPIISVAAGAVSKVVVTYALVSIPALNIKGSPLSSIISSFVISAMNFYFIGKHIGFKPNFIKIVFRPLLAATLCALTAGGCYGLLEKYVGNAVSIVVAIGAAMVVYGISIFLIKAVGREDVELLPKGKKLAALLTKMRLLR